MSKMTITISHTINIGNYESIKPEVSMEFDTSKFDPESEWEDNRKKMFKTVEENWFINLEKHLNRVYKIRKVKMLKTSDLELIAKTYNIKLVNKKEKTNADWSE